MNGSVTMSGDMGRNLTGAAEERCITRATIYETKKD